MANYPSIFNDVIGPVMRGPSSSHCAAALRIGRICRDLMDRDVEEVVIKFDPIGSLATTHESQGSDMGFIGGLLGWDADDERLLNYKNAVAETGIKIEIVIEDIGAKHPNTYDITLKNKMEKRTLTALSTGGGIIEIIKIDGADISIAGDYYETLLYSYDVNAILEKLKDKFTYEEVNVCKVSRDFIEIKSHQLLDANQFKNFVPEDLILSIKQISPVLPVLSHKNMGVTFVTCEQMLEYNKGKNLELWELAIHYETERAGLTKDEIFKRMKEIVRIMKGSIDSGLSGTEYSDRILGTQSISFKKLMKESKLIGAETLNNIILFVTAIMEVKSSMGVIVAAPTAGSCGALPGAVFGTAEAIKIDEEKIIKAMLTAGMIGIFIAAHSSFAAEVGGCMAECGSASGMAAAAIVALAGGSLEQSLSAASVALQNSFGMTCDPIANRVEAPCLGKNVMAAANALSCANMALADYQHLIPLDEVIEAMNEVANEIPRELKCTALGGLSATKTSREIERKLNKSK